MTKLFTDDDYENWTDLANEYSREISAALKPIVEKAANAGISLRDLAYVISTETSLSICSEILHRNGEIAKKKRKLQ